MFGHRDWVVVLRVKVLQPAEFSVPTKHVGVKAVYDTEERGVGRRRDGSNIGLRATNERRGERV